MHWAKQEILIIKSNGQNIQSFDYKNGLLKWEWSLFKSNDKVSSKYQIIEANTQSGLYYISNGNELCLVSSNDRSCVDFKNALNEFSLFVNNYGVIVSGLSNDILLTIQYNSLVNAVLSENSVSTKSSKCKIANNKILCQTSDSLKIGDLNLSEVKLIDYKLPESLMEKSDLSILVDHDNSYLLTDSQSNVYLLKLSTVTQTAQLVKVFHEASSRTVIPNDNDKFLIIAKTVENKVEIRCYSLYNDGNEEQNLFTSIDMNEKLGVLYLDAVVQQNNLNLFILFDDYSLSLYAQSGKEFFKREEALAEITSVEMIDLPLRQKQEDFENEFGHSDNDDILFLFIKRIKSQIHQIKEYFEELTSQKINDGEKNIMKRDNFGLNKLIVAVTSIGKVFGIHSSNGQIIWSFYRSNIKPFEIINSKSILPLYVQRTTSHYPHEPQMAIVSKLNEKTVVTSFNPLDGNISDSQDYDFTVKQVFLSNTMNNQFFKPLILFDSQNRLNVYPKTAASFIKSNLKSPLVIFVANSNSLTGYTVTVNNLVATEAWNINFGDEEIITIGSRLPNDKVHSHGKVLGNRNVLYKYINPNLIAIVTEGLDSQKIQFVNVYLIDTINGNIVTSFNHKKTKGPVNIVQSENWFFYSYYNLRLKRNEVTSVELFEGSSKYNSTYFSSFDPIKPIIASKSFILQKAIDSMRITITEKGITPKDIIAATPNGILYEIPWALIDARRPLELTEIEREEGLIPYMPEIPLNYEFSLNYYNYVYNVRGVATAPSGLESTSLVFVYGLDTYFTRVFPSKTFDMLREDFDYLFITIFIAALLFGSIFTKRIANSANLKKAWK